MTTSDILTIVTAIIGILVSYYFFRQAQKEKKPCWDVTSNNLIRNFSSKISKLEIVYAQEKIENLTISRIMFWNNGAETIEKHHIVSADPLRISSKSGIKILDAEILAQNNRYSNFSATRSNDQLYAYIEFDYLDKENGAVVQIIHTGVSSKDIRVEGSIKGVKRIRRKRIDTVWFSSTTPTEFDRRFSPLVRRRILILINSFVAIMVLIACVYLISSPLPKGFENSSRRFMIANASFLFSVFTATTIRLWTTASPKGLEIFEDELTV
jgi:hypothetical protein